jgi:outer membrane protein TolC
MRSIAALLVCLALPGLARAERPLSLDEALALARAANRDLTAARERVVQADADVAVARARLMPTLAARGQWVRNDQGVSFALGGATVTLQPKDQLTGSATLTVPLVVPPAYPGVSAAKHGRAASAATFEATTADVLLSVAQAFYAAAGTDELLAARREAIAVTTQTLRDARARLGAGAASPVDVTRAELSAIQAEQAVTEAEDGRARAYRALATLIQLREPFVVAPGSREVASPEPVEALSERALAIRPELRAARELVAARDAQAASRAWSWAPTVAAFGTATGSDVPGLTGKETSWMAGLQLEWSILDGGVRDAERRRATSQRREAEAQLASTHDAIVDDLADKARAVETRRSAVETATRGERLAGQALEVVRTQYAAGAASQIELLQAQDALVSARVGLAQARFDLAVADLALRRASGEFPDAAGTR